MGVPLGEWVRLLDDEYLAEFVAAGGAAVKIAVAPAEAAARVCRSVAGIAQERGYITALVDASRTRVHMVDAVFHEVARQVNWEEAVDECLRRLASEGGIRVNPGQPLSEVDAIARENGMDRYEVVRELSRLVRNGLAREHTLGREFRTAIARLCVGSINPQSVSAEDREAVLQWLRGEKASLPRLKNLGIFQRIGRHNARLMLLSLARWLARGAHSGLVLVLDVNAVAAVAAPGGGLRYARRTALDVYEVMRQFIDDTDEAEHILVVAVGSPDLIDDPKRGVVENYAALRLRIENEVRDRERDNPLNTMVRLETEDRRGETTWTGTR